MNPQEWFERKFIRIKGKEDPKDRCKKYLLDLKAKEFPYCPNCGDKEFWKIKSRVLLHCKKCNYQISPTANSVFHRVKKITHWFKAFWQMAGTENPSISELKRVTGFSSRHTTIKCFKLIQALMGVANFTSLSQNIYLGHTIIKINNKKRNVLIAVEAENKNDLPDNIRIEVIDNDQNEYTDFLLNWINDNANIYLPWDLSYHFKNDIADYTYTSNEGIEIPTVKKTYQLFLDWCKKNYRNNNSFDKLESNLSEFIWRFNRYRLITKKTDFSFQWKQRDRFEELIRLALIHYED